MTAVRIAVLLALPVIGGCGAFLDTVRQRQMAPRLTYHGFSFDRPASTEWYLLRSEEDYTDVILRRAAGGSGLHTFYARVSLGGIDREPASHEEFAVLVRTEEQRAPYEVRTVSYEQALTTRQDQWCIRFDGTYVAVDAPKAEGRELTMIVRGYRCLHPAWPATTLDFYYSERGPAAELDPRLAEEGEAFLDGVRIEIGPNRRAP